MWALVTYSNCKDEYIMFKQEAAKKAGQLYGVLIVA